MKRILFSALLATLPLVTMAQIGITLNVGDPNFYGQIDVQDGPPPPVVYSTPIIVEQGQSDYDYQPLYLRVPEPYHRNWPYYCRLYNACRHPVFFVREDWYANDYAPRYREHYPRGRSDFAPRVYYVPQEGYERRNEERREGRVVEPRPVEQPRNENREGHAVEQHRDDHKDERRDEHRDEHHDDRHEEDRR